MNEIKVDVRMFCWNCLESFTPRRTDEGYFCPSCDDKLAGQDVGVYMRNEIFHEKIDMHIDPDYDVWWSLPSYLEVDDVGVLLFVASENEWKGVFRSLRKEKQDEGSNLRMYLNDWYEFEKSIERKPFQGFTYDIPNVEVEI